jgi:hypothetical protein
VTTRVSFVVLPNREAKYEATRHVTAAKPS